MRTSRPLAMSYALVGKPVLRAMLALGAAAVVAGCSGSLPAAPTRDESPTFTARVEAPLDAATATPRAEPEPTERRPRRSPERDPHNGPRGVHQRSSR